MGNPVPIGQSSFVGGEIAPGLHARRNLARYPESARLLRNMIPKQEGPATNRPGLLYKGSAANHDTAVKGRLYGFVFSSGSLANNFVLEFLPLSIRIWKNGALIESSPGVPLVITTTYTATEIPRLKFTQLGGLLTIFCAQKTPMELQWLTDTSWTFTAYSLAREISPPTNLDFVVQVGNPPVGDDLVVAKYWEIVVTAVKAETKEESLPSNVIAATMAVSANKPAAYQWTAVAGASEYNVYRGRNGKFGFVGTSIGRTTFQDDGQYPVYAEVPPMARNPFPGANDHPMVGTYHDQRLVVGNAWNNPTEIEGSRIGEHRNFDRAAPPKTTDAVTFNVPTGQYEEIRSLVSYGRHLLILTNATEQLVTGNEGIIAQDDLVFDDHPTKWGSDWLDPLLIGPAVVFAQDVGATVRELLPLEKMSGNDLTLVAQHLLIGHKIISWCYAHEPFRVIWAVRDDGALLSCTYVRQLEQWAWARHDTGGDIFESVCSVPETTESAVYFMVRRYVNGQFRRYFEKLAPRVNQSLWDGVFLDSAVTKTNVTTVTGLTHLIGREVYALVDGAALGPFTVSGQGEITLPAPATKVHVGLRITAQGHTLDIYSTEREVRTARKLVKKVYLEVEGSMPFKAGQRLTDTLQLATRVDGLYWSAPLAPPYQTPYTGLVQVNINADWDDSGAVVWEHTDPTPLTIMSVIREVDFGGY